MTAPAMPRLDAANTAILREMERRRLAGELDAAGLLALSDLYDDAGDDDMAAFCRYMPDNPRKPGFYSKEPLPWTWFADDLIEIHDELPREVVKRLEGKSFGQDGLTKDYPTREAAERDLGRVVRELGLV